MKVFIDSSVIIDHFRTYTKNKQTLFQELSDTCDVLYFSLITVGELFSGKSAEKSESKIMELFKLGEIISLDIFLMKEAGKIRRETNISLLDSIIAASALKLNLPVATLNTKDFSKIKGLKLYSIL